MSRSKEAEPKPNIPIPTKLAVLLGFLAASYAYSQNAGIVQNTDPIRVPADVERIDKDNRYTKSFKMKVADTASVFCGKVSLKLQPDYEVPKIITGLQNGQVRVDCSTLGYDVPIERSTLQK